MSSSLLLFVLASESFVMYCSEESVRDELNWLKYNSQPWTEVLRKWQFTSLYRVQQWLDGVKDVDAF